MSGKPALIRESDVARIVKGYAKAGITVGMTLKNGLPVFLPVDQIQPANEPSPEPDAETAFREEMKARHAG